MSGSDDDDDDAEYGPGPEFIEALKDAHKQATLHIAADKLVHAVLRRVRDIGLDTVSQRAASTLTGMAEVMFSAPPLHPDDPPTGQESTMLVIVVAQLMDTTATMLAARTDVPREVVLLAMHKIAMLDDAEALKKAPPAGTG